MSKITALSEIVFADRDAESIQAGLIARYEAASGKALYPGDPVRLFLDSIAYELALQRSIIDYTGRMNLLAYATGDYLDHIGAMLGVYRLKPAAAICAVRVTLSAAQSFAVTIPAGTRVSSGGEIIFAVSEATEIAAGETIAEITCTCTSTGTIGNGFLAGQLSTLVDPIAYVKSVDNLGVSSGGADVESDENLRERIQLAPESFSVAGPYGAYRFWARSAHQDIHDVAVLGPERTDGTYRIAPGEVHVFPLMAGGGELSVEVLDLVKATLDDDKIRPLSDTVIVKAPERTEYDLDVVYYIDRDDAAVATSIQSAVNTAVLGWVGWQREKLGRDINVSELVRRIVNAGAKRAVVRSPTFTEVAANAVAVCGNTQVRFGGLEDG
ncbi:baseplate assembly protein [Cloacibacillus evryensis]|uniref:baseplate assembly protein n=1 Tax=Cloacibacillus evryensis TaxID=508460 RepID=UPI002672B957|nr:baseplate J/gp47 family protein [Cloacibacillus evryensis]